MWNVSVKIFSSVVTALCSSAIKLSPDETGGVLVGTRNYGGNDLEFNILGALTVSDFEEFRSIYTASPTRFVCTDKMGWAKLALKAVERYGMSYIGDWHSHPRNNLAILSELDISMLEQQYLLRQFAPFPPLHLLLRWFSSCSDIHLTANVMLNQRIIAVINPKIINNRTDIEND